MSPASTKSRWRRRFPKDGGEPIWGWDGAGSIKENPAALCGYLAERMKEEGSTPETLLGVADLTDLRCLGRRGC